MNGWKIGCMIASGLAGFMTLAYIGLVDRNHELDKSNKLYMLSNKLQEVVITSQNEIIKGLQDKDDQEEVEAA